MKSLNRVIAAVVSLGLLWNSSLVTDVARALSQPTIAVQTADTGTQFNIFPNRDELSLTTYDNGLAIDFVASSEGAISVNNVSGCAYIDGKLNNLQVGKCTMEISVAATPAYSSASTTFTINIKSAWHIGIEIYHEGIERTDYLAEVGDTFAIWYSREAAPLTSCDWHIFTGYRNLFRGWTTVADDDGVCRMSGMVQTYDLRWSEWMTNPDIPGNSQGVCNGWVGALVFPDLGRYFEDNRVVPRTEWVRPDAPCGSNLIRELVWRDYIPLDIGQDYRWPSADFRDWHVGNQDFEFGVPWKLKIEEDLASHLCPSDASSSTKAHDYGPFTIGTLATRNGIPHPNSYTWYEIASKTLCPDWEITLPGAVPTSGNTELDEELAQRWDVVAYTFINDSAVWNYNLRSANSYVDPSASSGAGLISPLPSSRITYPGEEAELRFAYTGTAVECGASVYSVYSVEEEFIGTMSNGVCGVVIPAEITSAVDPGTSLQVTAWADYGSGWAVRYAVATYPLQVIDPPEVPTLSVNLDSMGEVEISADAKEQQGLAVWIDTSTTSTVTSISNFANEGGAATELSGSISAAVNTECDKYSLASVAAGIDGEALGIVEKSCALPDGNYELTATFMTPAGKKYSCSGHLALQGESRLYVPGECVGDSVSSVGPANTSRPRVEGSAVVGTALTGVIGAWSGRRPLTYAYQWYRCNSRGGPTTSIPSGCSPIVGANVENRTTAADDYNKFLRFAVTATNSGGSSTSVSAATARVAGLAPANSGGANVPTVSGAAKVGQTVSAGVGTWVAVPAPMTSYAWFTCGDLGSGAVASTSLTGCTVIRGATGSTLAVSPAQVGSHLRVRVTQRNNLGTASYFSAATAAVVANPIIVGAPVLTGTPRVGTALSGSNGTWTGADTYAYAWARCTAGGSAVAGATPPTGCTLLDDSTSSTYTALPDDYQRFLRLRVTATNGEGDTSHWSAASRLIAASLPANSGGGNVPTVAGTAKIGQSLSAAAGTWSGTPAPTYRYDWFSCLEAGSGAVAGTRLTGCTAIRGATASSFVPTSAQLNRFIRVRVTARNPGGTASYFSASTSAITAP